MDVLTSETCWALNNEIKKQVTSSWSRFIQQRTVSLFTLILLSKELCVWTDASRTNRRSFMYKAYSFYADLLTQVHSSEVWVKEKKSYVSLRPHVFSKRKRYGAVFMQPVFL